MKFLLDANIPYSAKEIFERKYQVFHARDLKLEKAFDQVVINWAKENKAIFITRDLDFANILNFPPEEYGGIVVLRLPYFYSASQIKRVMKQFLESISSEDLLQCIIIVEEGKIRIRSYKTE